jgi:hypothetical protein
MRLAAFVLMLLAAPELVACSCSPSGPACRKVGFADEVFLGRVVQGIPGLFPHSRIYIFAVEAAYKGLAPNTRIAFVDSGGSMCGAMFWVGERFLVYGGRGRGAFKNGVVYTSACHGNRQAKDAKADLEFVESYALGRSTTRIFGKTLQLAPWRKEPPEDEQAPVPGATVTLRSGKQTWKTMSGPDGSYAFEGVKPGKYEVSATSVLPGYRGDGASLEVQERGCDVGYLELRPQTSLSGRAVDYRGRFAKNVRVELLHKSSRGKWYHETGMWANTDSRGRFEFTGIPAGEYLLGQEIRSESLDPEAPIQMVYYPGVPDRAAAAVLRVEPLKPVNGIRLRLPKPDTPRRVTVEVRWPDGSKPGPNHLVIRANGTPIEGRVGLRADEPVPRHLPNVFRLKLYQERAYRIEAKYEVDGIGGPVPFEARRVAKSKIVVVKPGSTPVTLRLVLGRAERVDPM